jgi:2-(1,2-epoxy-1,2-dihydrophenyl)acetyl-CoA isomerase
VDAVQYKARWCGNLVEYGCGNALAGGFQHSHLTQDMSDAASYPDADPWKEGNMSELVLYEQRDGVATIKLNRPGAGNAIDRALGAEFADIVDQLAGQVSAARMSDTSDGSDKQVPLRAILLTAGGDRFCVGGDIGEMLQAENLPGLMQASIPRLHAAMARLAALPCPIVTAINGPVGGGGIGLALCGDIVLAAQSMKLRGGYSAIGLSPDLGASWYLARRAGAAQAKRILFLNQPVGADECLTLGLVDAVYPDERLAEEAQALAARLAAGATASFGRIKDLVDGAGSRTFEEHLALEARHMIASAGCGDAAEGVRAFLEKRQPAFQGR